MIRGALSLGFIICVIGLFSSGDLSWLVPGFIIVMAFGLVQTIVDWLGLDEGGGGRSQGEYFYDIERNFLHSQAAHRPRDVGSVVPFNGRNWRIIERGTDDDGDLMYVVSGA